MDKNELRQKYKIQDVLFHFGIQQSRYKRISCPMHNGTDKNCQVSDSIIHCHVCNESADLFKLYAILSNSTSLAFNELIQRFCDDFGETYQTKPNHVKPNHSELEQQRKIKRARYFCRMEQLRIARYRKEIYRPKDMDGPVDDRWIVACRQERVITDYMQAEGFEIKREIEEEWCRQYETERI